MKTTKTINVPVKLFNDIYWCACDLHWRLDGDVRGKSRQAQIMKYIRKAERLLKAHK